MNRNKVGFILVLIGGILSLVYGAALVILSIIAKTLSARIPASALTGDNAFMGMGAGQITSMMMTFSPLAIVAGAIVIIFGVLLIIGSRLIKKSETHKKGALISIILGIIGLILSWFWWPSFNLLPATILMGMYIIIIIGGILGYK